jgi:hypothetical protein
MSQERFFTTRNIGALNTGYRVPAPPRDMARPGRWIAPGETVEVLDYIIRGGMLYVGTGMKDPQGTPEPSLINPLCPVQPTYGSYSTRSLDYWPNYSAIAPEARGAYLGWLASGRSHPKADIGFVFMYFYGLERRAFIDSYADTQAQEEWPLLIEEVRRLLGIYGHGHRPLTERANRFVDMLLAAKSAKNLVIGQGKYASVTSDMPFELKKDLGNLALTGTPLSGEKALAWADSDPGLKRGVALNRLPRSFNQMFSLLYQEAYPEGLIIPVAKTKLMMLYEPASQAVAGFGEIGLYLDDIPDVTIQGGTSLKIQALIDRCNESLAPYSRFIIRHPELSNAIGALVLLPEALWPESLTSALAQWQARVLAGPCLTTATEVMTSFGASATSAKDLLPVLNALTSVQVGIEPELVGKLPKLDEPVVLFHMGGDADSARANPAYVAARITLQLAHHVALVDGAKPAETMEFIARQVDGWVHLTRAHRARLVAYSHYLRAMPVPLATIKKNAAAIEPLARSAIAMFLCRVAQLGQDATPASVKVLAKLYKMFDIDPARLHGDLHAAAAGKAGPAPGPALDPTRIAALQKDTAFVSALLADIFVEDEESIPPPSTAVQLSKASDTGSVMGLDAAHSSLVQIMHKQSAWTRPALQAQAAALGLMLDGALEHINDAAFDLFDMPFIEGEDPFEINPDLPESLTP